MFDLWFVIVFHPNFSDYNVDSNQNLNQKKNKQTNKKKKPQKQNKLKKKKKREGKEIQNNQMAQILDWVIMMI